MALCFWRWACVGQDRHDCWGRGAVATLAGLACPAFNVASHFARLVIAENLSDRGESEVKIASGAFHYQFHIEDRVDAFTETAHDGAQLFSHQ
eukprot:5257801-Pleurochrysis_carterae.AAC.3